MGLRFISQLKAATLPTTDSASTRAASIARQREAHRCLLKLTALFQHKEPPLSRHKRELSGSQTNCKQPLVLQTYWKHTHKLIHIINPFIRWSSLSHFLRADTIYLKHDLCLDLIRNSLMHYPVRVLWVFLEDTICLKLLITNTGKTTTFLFRW